MSRQAIPNAKSGTLPNWFRAVCLALVILLAHNPYLTVPATASGVNVSHHPSYRATVAASELQHFSPQDKQSSVDVVSVPTPNVLDPLKADERQPRVYSSQVLSPQPQFWSAGLWFRPPPVS
jgi:hypothetical protein